MSQNPSSLPPMRRQTLDGPPPQPPGAPSRVLQSAGPGAGDPIQAAAMGLMMMKRGSQLLLSVLPGLSPMIAELMSGLEQTVPQAMSELQQQGSSILPGQPSIIPPGQGTGPL